MTSREESQEMRASREATDWLIFLQEDPDNVELQRRFEAWFAASAVNRQAWDATAYASDLIAKLPPSYEATWRAHLEKSSPEDAFRPKSESRRYGQYTPYTPYNELGTLLGNWAGRFREIRPAGYGLAVFSLAACLLVFALSGARVPWFADHTTVTAELRTLSLEDGSQVVMAPETSISVDYSATERRVRLHGGAAFFTVDDDAERPFRVTVGDIETVDLGTAFSVRRSKNGAEIAVAEGSVRVDLEDEDHPVSETLLLGETVNVSWQGVAVRATTPPSQIALWRENQLIARNQSMRHIVDQLRPYVSGRIVFANSDLSERRVTGIFNLENPHDALRGVAEAHGAQVIQITPWLLVLVDQ